MTMNEINAAALMSARAIADAEPYWVGVENAIDLLDGFDEYTVLHSGPPIEYEKMCELHRRGMRNAVLFEGLAKTDSEAEKMILSGKIKIKSAFDFNTVGSGVGIVSASVPLLVTEDRRTGIRAGVFPHESKFGGGFCGWGVFSDAIKENLIYIGKKLLSPIKEVLKDRGGFALKPIIAEGLKMGDENHSSQNAVDALFIRSIIPLALKCKNYDELLLYFSETPRFFHNFCQSASRAAVLGAHGIDGSPVVTAAGGNGVEYGIKVSGLGDEWFTSQSPMIEGTYMTDGAKRDNQLPWIGDSSVVECAGLGGLLSAASPKVCSWRGESMDDGIKTTESMRRICVSENENYSIPTMNFSHAPVGIDILKVTDTGILPVIDGGMIDKNGGWIGAGCAKIPAECFASAKVAFDKKYHTNFNKGRQKT